MPSNTEKLLSLLNGQPVIPVLKISDIANAVPLARALARASGTALAISEIFS
ncbi:keto-deoxy-phosphogluconate aldolase, partial [Mesorhizobium sp. M7A.F.Ca.CA.004.10.1.1]